MDVTELNRDQLNELKTNYLFDKDGREDVSYWEIYTAHGTLNDISFEHIRKEAL